MAKDEAFNDKGYNEDYESTTEVRLPSDIVDV